VRIEVNDVLLTGMIIMRLYFITRSILNTSNYLEPRAQRVCQLFGCEASVGFAIKVMMKDNPNVVVLTGLLMSIAVLGYTSRLFERDVSEDFNSIAHMMWYCLMSMTTVGYGEYKPRTYMGRLICIICCFWGVFIVSLMVVSLSNMLAFESTQNKSYLLLLRLKEKDKIMLHAADMLASKYQLLLHLRERKPKFETEMKINRKYRKHQQMFRKIGK